MELDRHVEMYQRRQERDQQRWESWTTEWQQKEQRWATREADLEAQVLQQDRELCLCKANLAALQHELLVLQQKAQHSVAKYMNGAVPRRPEAKGLTEEGRHQLNVLPTGKVAVEDISIETEEIWMDTTGTRASVGQHCSSADGCSAQSERCMPQAWDGHGAESEDGRANMSTEMTNILEARRKLQTDRLKVREDRANLGKYRQHVELCMTQVQEDKATLKEDTARLEEEKVGLQRDRVTIEKERARLQQGNNELQQERSKVAQDQASINKDREQGSRKMARFTPDMVNMQQPWQLLEQDRVKADEERVRLSIERAQLDDERLTMVNQKMKLQTEAATEHAHIKALEAHRNKLSSGRKWAMEVQAQMDAAFKEMEGGSAAQVQDSSKSGSAVLGDECEWKSLHVRWSRLSGLLLGS